MLSKKNPEMEIGRNSSLYFAIGLSIMLFISWQLLEYKTYDKTDIAYDMVNMEEVFEEEIPVINVNAPPPPPPPVAIQESIKIVEDVVEIEETIIESTESNQSDKIAEPVSVAEVAVEDVEEDVEVPFAVIEDIPVFPGCETGSKREKRACFQAKMEEHIAKNFHYPEQALDLGIQGKVFVIFVIDKDGYVTGIRSRGPDKILEKEAERIIKLLPRMIPGKQRGRPVKVPYSVPIVFKYMAS
ncbi:MAG: energy transducer TonB [Flavobacteriales bacterium]|nr:energy transducer TonB [Flavobacteriia bacterium]NCP05082.1 energy transducer TonB [Flavobacteriales bacterium]PIV92615.1 MAG: energy transducer TonB [Flavobacteriaceae bacterium CG17_big_fil_post_rev_8_21_14_2_50_33_15]PIY12961.1 MAG: energy transducer TonB [Flavobacteriaceae bacterium CG_4_10_14_3_um_filter_33_47]PJB20071.1 MAG: energy transducer TonB [Flavobacteriaceae bacterium CG_4_9_14_3_um_filter_33_16]